MVRKVFEFRITPADYIQTKYGSVVDGKNSTVVRTRVPPKELRIAQNNVEE